MPILKVQFSVTLIGVLLFFTPVAVAQTASSLSLSGLTTNKLSSPGTPTGFASIPSGCASGGSGTWTYVVVALDAAGGMTSQSSSVGTTTGSCTLSSTQYFFFTTQQVPGTASCAVYRTQASPSSGPGATGMIGKVLCGQIFYDFGANNGDNTSPPSANVSGAVSATGNVFAPSFTAGGNGAGTSVYNDNNIGIDAIGFEGVSPDPTYDQARNGYIGENSVFDITSQGNPSYPRNCWCADGIYVDGGTNIIIERNLVHNVDLGIEMASEHSGHVSSYITTRGNLIYFGNSAGISIGGYANSVGGTDHVDVVNNTLFKNDGKNTGSGEFQIQYHATNNIFENNIAYAGPQALLVNDYTKSTPEPAKLDYNLYYSPVTASNSNWVWQAAGITGFTTYQTKSKQDSHSIYASPEFLNTTTPNLQVEPTSPAVNAGNNLGVTIDGTLDFAGNPRVQGSNIDIGAYEQ